ncbi:MAG: cupin domain-containing protein [Phycisphaerales bacterium]|nr:cupin domain-containing protein [Phycisphaerales bacterium]
MPLQGCYGDADGHHAAAALIAQARHYVERLNALDMRAVLGRVRGTGPGVSFGAVIETIRRGFPIDMQSPFEGSENVSGGILLPASWGTDGDDGFLFLRFSPGTKDLPLHSHEHSDRFIYVLGGRGFFCVSEAAGEGGRDQTVRRVPIRSRDVVMFKRGVVHTFETANEPLRLLSYHAPFVPLNDPKQYSIAPIGHRSQEEPTIQCDAAWLRLG